MQLDAVLNLLKKTKSSLTAYRNYRFAATQIAAKEACEKMNTNTLKKKKRNWENEKKSLTMNL